jgi:hypothetical protein
MKSTTPITFQVFYTIIGIGIYYEIVHPCIRYEFVQTEVDICQSHFSDGMCASRITTIMPVKTCMERR